MNAFLLSYDKNCYANNAASWYSLYFVIYRTHEGSCSCTRFETYEPLRHRTYLLGYIHFVPNLKFGAKVYILINVRKTALSDCLRQILFLNYRKFQIFNLDGCKEAKISVLYRIICSLQNE